MENVDQISSIYLSVKQVLVVAVILPQLGLTVHLVALRDKYWRPLSWTSLVGKSTMGFSLKDFDYIFELWKKI